MPKGKQTPNKVELGVYAFAFTSPFFLELAKAADVDFVAIDMEHSATSFERVADTLQVAKALSVTSLVRVSSAHRETVSKILDQGADAVILPMSEDLSTIKQAIAWSRYAPEGNRGAYFGSVHDDFSNLTPTELMKKANSLNRIIPQIETKAGVAACKEIAKLEGIHSIWIGQFDLSIDMGIPGDFQNPLFLSAQDKIILAAKENNLSVGIMAGNLDEAKRYLDAGFNVVAVGGDQWLLKHAIANNISAARNHLIRKESEQ